MPAGDSDPDSDEEKWLLRESTRTLDAAHVAEELALEDELHGEGLYMPACGPLFFGLGSLGSLVCLFVAHALGSKDAPTSTVALALAAATGGSVAILGYAHIASEPVSNRSRIAIVVAELVVAWLAVLLALTHRASQSEGALGAPGALLRNSDLMLPALLPNGAATIAYTCTRDLVGLKATLEGVPPALAREIKRRVEAAKERRRRRRTHKKKRRAKGPDAV